MAVDVFSVFKKGQLTKETKKSLSCHKVHYWDRKMEGGDQPENSV